MKSERPNEVEFEAKVVRVGRGDIVVEMPGGGVLSLPATTEFEKWAGAMLYKWIKVRVQCGSSLEELPRG